MNKLLTLSSVNYPEICLRSIRDNDQNNLRDWKNKNSERFFYQGIISASAQLGWYDGYLMRDRDYMFMVGIENCAIGCAGIRLLDDVWDVYNVILGNSAFSGKGYMKQALRLMCSFAYNTMPLRISAKVLSNNPAINWYKKNGFRVVSEQDNYVEIELEESFEFCSIIISS